ncbi:MAG: hypothetical protein FJ202_03360 [Gemmatimonadetes bacterium]|nr:hypothetical protein [Gemmatimonadota bacterium]
MTRRSPRLIVVAAAGLWLTAAVAACSGDSSAPTASASASVVGTWNLQQVGNSPLPYLIDQNGADKSELTGGTLVFLSSGFFTEVSTVRNTTGGQVSMTSVPQGGTFTANKGAVQATFAGAAEASAGTYTASTLTIAIGGLPMTYRR